MSGAIGGLVRTLPGLGLLTILAVITPRAEGGGRWAPRRAVAVPTVSEVTVRPRATGTLGTFASTPYIMVRGSGTTGGGFSPLGSYGDASMSLYGPLSSLRYTSAPVLTVTRGYDGRTRLSEATSFSAPNLPALTPVVYPTQATNYYGFRESGTPPWWANAINWLDQN